MMDRNDHYAVFGNPVAHSKSPLIHSLFAAQTRQDMTYDRKLVPLGGFAHAAQTFFAEGGKGLNITVPFKLDAFAFAEQQGAVSERAKRAGAVNTLKKLDDGKIYGDNTDGVGLVRDITQNLGWEINGKHILILGAGGAVRGVLGPILEQQPAAVVIANRTASKAQELVQILGSSLLRACAYPDLQQPFDLMINGTSASLANELPPLERVPLSSNTACYDMMYGKVPGLFLQWATTHGSERTADGLGMLVEQAAESFYLWRGVRPDTAPVLAEVRHQL